MKQKVKFSTFSLIMTAAIIILFAVGIFTVCDNPAELILFCLIFGAVILSGLYYCPESIEADDSGVMLHRLLSKSKKFQYDTIQSVDTCYPSAGALRLCGSGGFFGYWGYFNDIMIGSYFGYYGSRDYCLFIKLRDGKQYVLGCENPTSMVEYIQSQLR